VFREYGQFMSGDHDACVYMHHYPAGSDFNSSDGFRHKLLIRLQLFLGRVVVVCLPTKDTGVTNFISWVFLSLTLSKVHKVSPQ
jgi:hypothetical protein